MGSAGLQSLARGASAHRARAPLCVAQVSFYLDPARRGPEELLAAWPSLVEIAEAASKKGLRVCVVQACAQRAALTRNGVSYRFVPPPAGSSSVTLGPEFGEVLREIRPDVIHVHGLGFPSDVVRLRRIAPHTPILIQDHASQLPKPWHRSRWRHALSKVSAIAFCAEAQSAPFVAARVLQPTTRIYAIPECSSHFTPGDRAAARAATGLYGDPCVLWVGHLDRNKDPLTILDGVSLAAAQLPNLHLWCCFGTATLLSDVRDRIRRDAALQERVHLLGRVEHAQIELLMRAADMFVLGSHREGSGYALIEALACGLPPVVTDIPSFRELTGGGTVGALWPCGDDRRMAQALLAIAPSCGPELRRAVRSHFDREVSFDALGRKLARAYAEMMDRASGYALGASRDR